MRLAADLDYNLVVVEDGCADRDPEVHRVLVEPVFGQVKERQDFRRFKRRGLEANSSEAALVGTTHNLLKLWRSGRAPWGWAKARWN